MNCSILEFSLINNYLAIRSDKVFSTKSDMKRLFTVTLHQTFSVILHPIPKSVRCISSWIPFTNVFVLSNCHNFLNELPWFTIRIPVHISRTKFSKSFHDVLMHIREKQFLCFCCDQFLSGWFIHVRSHFFLILSRFFLSKLKFFSQNFVFLNHLVSVFLQLPFAFLDCPKGRVKLIDLNLQLFDLCCWLLMCISCLRILYHLFL